MKKSGRGGWAQRRRSESGPRDARSGEGAASALATLREIERNRNACAPAEDPQYAAAGRAGVSSKPGDS